MGVLADAGHALVFRCHGVLLLLLSEFLHLHASIRIYTVNLG